VRDKDEGVMNGLIIAIAVGAGLAVSISLVILLVVTRRGTETKNTGASPAELVVLLRQGRVIDTTPDVEDMLGKPLSPDTPWADLRPVLANRFADLPLELPGQDTSIPASDDANTLLSISVNGPFTRLSINGGALSMGHVHRIVNIREESEQIARILHLDPNPIWKMNANGNVTWSNDSYQRICDESAAAGQTSCPFAVEVDGALVAQNGRISVSLPGEEKQLWFEVTSFPVGADTVYYATGINDLVEAERAQRNFVQTLAKTFAHLPIGLAVFNKERRLVLFNPALVDLTRLPIDFLSAKPNLLSFFDHMRENRMMPEPKSYSSWRGKLYEVVSAAREDRYSETWSLPSGLTYRITGRPHPDGAVAFLIEDISAEISLTRRFRSELDLTQSVLDSFDSSIVVFTRLGVQSFCNSAYRELWGLQADPAVAETSIIDAIQSWEDLCDPQTDWSEIRDYVLNLQNRKPWETELVLNTGERLLCKIEPVAAGATLMRFSYLPSETRSLPQLKAEAVS
jgi:PAS domain-containing protein